MPGTFSFIKIIINYGRFLKMSVTNANVQGKQNFWQLKRMVVMAFFIALSVVGAMLKIPSPTGTVALDSAPGFLGAALLGWREGALIAALGHLISSYTAGLFTC
jgi:hypothetical protein